jgi:hypothetical protein
MFNKVSIGFARGIAVAIACDMFIGMGRLANQEGGMWYTIIAGLVLLITIIAMIIVGILTRRIRDDTSMPVAQRWFLVAYLLVMGTCFAYFLGVLGSADFPETAMVVSSGNAGQVSSTPEGPVLKHVFPESTTGNVPDMSLMLYGENFKEDATVRVNSKERAAQSIERGALIKAPLQQSDLSGVGALTVEVINPDKKVSNAVILPITKPVITIDFLGRRLSVTRELQLLLLVLFAGALGSYIHAIRSLTDFIGNRTVVASWFWWYVARPFVGMSMALIFYAVLRGGFLAGTPADAKVVNPFGVIAIGALVGMFSDKAAQKLAEVFDTLFKAEDTRKDKLTSPVIEKIQPDHVRPATTPPPEVTISGTHLSVVEKVRVNQQDRIPKNVNDKQVVLALTAVDVAQSAEITLAVVDKAGIVTSAGIFFVTDLDINAPTNAPTPDTLAPAAHGQAYTQIFTATGGTGPYQWEIVNKVPGLRVGETDGKLEGTPPSAGDFSVNIKVTDTKSASVSKTFKLRVS